MNAVVISMHCGLIFNFNGMCVTATDSDSKESVERVFFVTHEPLRRNVNRIYRITCIWAVAL